MDFGKMPFSDIFFFPWPSLLTMLCKVARAGLYIKPASDFIEVDRPVTQSLGISTYITVCLYPQSDPM